MSDTQNEPLPGEKAIKVKKAGPILSGADRYDIFEKGQKAIREFVEELFRFLIDFPGPYPLLDRTERVKYGAAVIEWGAGMSCASSWSFV